MKELIQPRNFVFDSTFISEERFGISHESDFLLMAIESIANNIRFVNTYNRLTLDSQSIRYVIDSLFHSPKITLLDQNEIVIQPQLIDFECSNNLRIVRLHDLFPITNSEWYPAQQTYLFKKSFKRLNTEKTAFIANSQYTKSVAINHGIEPKNITVVPCFTSIRESNPCGHCSICVKNEVPHNYVLAVGTLEPRKNYEGLVDFWLRLDSSYPKLLVVGKYGWGSFKGKSVDQVEFAGYVCDFQLINLYRNAHLFISNSSDEGFNIPIHHAAQIGIPILATNIEVNKEKNFKIELYEKNDFQDFRRGLSAAMSQDLQYHFEPNSDEQVDFLAQELLRIIQAL